MSRKISTSVRLEKQRDSRAHMLFMLSFVLNIIHSKLLTKNIRLRRKDKINPTSLLSVENLERLPLSPACTFQSSDVISYGWPYRFCEVIPLVLSFSNYKHICRNTSFLFAPVFSGPSTSAGNPTPTLTALTIHTECLHMWQLLDNS